MPDGAWGCSFVPVVFVECPCSEDISDTSQEPSPPKAFAVSRCGSSHKPGIHMSPQLHGSDSGAHKGQLKACGKRTPSLLIACEKVCGTRLAGVVGKEAVQV